MRYNKPVLTRHGSIVQVVRAKLFGRRDFLCLRQRVHGPIGTAGGH